MLPSRPGMLSSIKSFIPLLSGTVPMLTAPQIVLQKEIMYVPLRNLLSPGLVCPNTRLTHTYVFISSSNLPLQNRFLHMSETCFFSFRLELHFIASSTMKLEFTRHNSINYNNVFYFLGQKALTCRNVCIFITLSNDFMEVCSLFGWLVGLVAKSCPTLATPWTARLLCP